MQRTILPLDAVVLTRLERGAKEKLGPFLPIKILEFDNRREGHKGVIAGQMISAGIYIVRHQGEKSLALYLESEVTEAWI